MDGIGGNRSVWPRRKTGDEEGVQPRTTLDRTKQGLP
jgi:hypothetical protein